MPKDNARRILADPSPATSEIEDAIAWLERDITYVQHFHPFADAKLRESIEESRSLLARLREKLNNQIKPS